MNAGLEHMQHVAARLGELATALATRITYQPGTELALKGTAHALAALEVHLTPAATLTARGVKVREPYAVQASTLLQDRELVYALVQASPRATSLAYIYLKAFHQWNATATSEEQEARHRHFGMALIVAGLFITSRYVEGRDHVRTAMEEAAYKVLSYDPGLRDILPALRDGYERASRV